MREQTPKAPPTPRSKTPVASTPGTFTPKAKMPPQMGTPTADVTRTVVRRPAGGQRVTVRRSR
jgi:hypothetical protein